MPVTSTIVPCPAGQWTSVAQYMETRRSLLIQCPEQADAISSAVVPIVNDNVTRTLIAANPLRKRLVVSIGAIDASTTEIFFFAGTGTSGGIYILPVSPQYPMVFDTAESRIAAEKWSANVNGNATHAQVFFLTVQIATCVAVIVGINTSGPTYTGPYGTVPLGIWTSPNLEAGPQVFRLDRDNDGELVKQEWFVWPVGSGTVNVQVFQTFDLPPKRSALVVQLPSMSPHGKLAAWQLIKAMRQKVKDGLRLSDDQEL